MQAVWVPYRNVTTQVAFSRPFTAEKRPAADRRGQHTLQLASVQLIIAEQVVSMITRKQTQKVPSVQVWTKHVRDCQLQG